jgi:tRNA dimethylallyltransferase
MRGILEGDPDTTLLYEQLQELDPDAAARMEPTNRRRIVRALEVTLGSGRRFSTYGPGLDAHPPTAFTMVGVRRETTDLRARIAARYDAQMAAGFLDEVRRLRDHPRGISRTAAQALGYKELLAHLAGEVSLDDALDLAVRRTGRFARRQWAWFRRDPRITWLDAVDDDANLLVDALGTAVG